MSSRLRPHHLPQIHPSMRRTICEGLAERVPSGLVLTVYKQFEKRLPELIFEGLAAQCELSKLNHEANHRGVDGLGQCTVRYHPKFRYAIALLFGWELAVNDQFLKEAERDNCSIKLQPRYQKLARVMVEKRVRWEVNAALRDNRTIRQSDNQTPEAPPVAEAKPVEPSGPVATDVKAAA